MNKFFRGRSQSRMEWNELGLQGGASGAAGERLFCTRGLFREERKTEAAIHTKYGNSLEVIFSLEFTLAISIFNAGNSLCPARRGTERRQ